MGGCRRRPCLVLTSFGDGGAGPVANGRGCLFGGKWGESRGRQDDRDGTSTRREEGRIGRTSVIDGQQDVAFMMNTDVPAREV